MDEDNLKLRAALKQLPRPAIPASVDRTIRDATTAHFAQLLQRRRNARRLSISAGMIAALCVVLLVCWIPSRQSEPRVAADHRDLNGDGQVDILDAFALARQIRDGQVSGQSDQTGEGRVDEADVQALAQLAVRLPARL